MHCKRTIPSVLLLHGRPYTPARTTDVVATWLKAGWVPPSRKDQERVKSRLNPLGVPV